MYSSDLKQNLVELLTRNSISESRDIEQVKKEKKIETGNRHVVLKLQNITGLTDKDLYAKTRDVFSSVDITLLKVELRHQTFKCEIDMRLFWRQPEIAKHVPADSMWSIFDDGQSIPIDVTDMFEHDTGPIWINNRFHYHENTQVVELHLQFTDTFSERMELNRFPVDRQFLNILLQSRVEDGNWNWIVEAPKWVPTHRRDIIRSRLGPSISEYELFEPWADFRVLDDADDAQPPFKLRLRVQRFTSYFVVSAIFPMFLIVSCCLVSTVVPEGIDNLARRLSVTITLMLSGVAARFTISEILPPVSYLTLMDYYLMIGFTLITGFILENTSSSIFENLYGIGAKIDFIFGGALIIIWLIVNIFMIIACYTNLVRIPWEIMDEIDRAPSPEDEFKPAPLEFVKGTYPKYDETLPKSNTAVD